MDYSLEQKKIKKKRKLKKAKMEYTTNKVQKKNKLIGITVTRAE